MNELAKTLFCMTPLTIILVNTEQNCPIHVHCCQSQRKLRISMFQYAERDIVLPFLSVSPSVRPSGRGDVSKRLHISSHFLHLVVRPMYVLYRSTFSNQIWYCNRTITKPRISGSTIPLNPKGWPWHPSGHFFSHRFN